MNGKQGRKEGGGMTGKAQKHEREISSIMCQGSPVNQSAS